jgi:hypothetical protein
MAVRTTIGMTCNAPCIAGVGRASTPAPHALVLIARSHRSRNSAEPESKTVLIANFATSTVVSVDAAEGPHRNLRP